MAKFKTIQNTFSQGMLSPKLRGRTDLQEYFQGAEKIVNYLGYKQGGLFRRPGSEYQVDLKTLNGPAGIKDLSDTACFLPYSSNSYIVSGSAGTYLVSNNQYTAVEVGLDYEGNPIQIFSNLQDLESIQGIFDYVQIGELLFITRPGRMPVVFYRYVNANGLATETGYKLQLVSLPIDQNVKTVYNPTTTFTKEEILLQPYRAPNIVAGKTATPSATTGSINVQFNFRVILEKGALIKIQQGAVTGVARVTAAGASAPGVTNYTCTVLLNFASTAASDNWQLTEWGLTDFSSYPTNVTVFEQRIIYGRKENLFGSQTGNFQKFMIRRLAQDSSTDVSGLKYFGDVKVTDPFDFIIASKEFQYVRWLQGGEVLEVGTNKGEYAVFGTEGQILSGVNVGITEQTNFGSSFCKALKANKETIFISSDRFNIRSFMRSDNSNTYDTHEIMALSEDIYIGEKFKDSYYQSNLNIMWLLTVSGKLKAMTLNRTFGIRSFIDIELDGTVLFCCIVNQKLTALVQRGSKYTVVSVGNEFKGTVLTGADFTFMDQSINFDQVASTTVSGLTHLEGEEVDVIGDGILYEELTVSGGAVTLPIAAAKGVAGLRFQSYVQTFNLEAGGQFGTSQGEKKRINEVQVKFYRSYKGKLGSTLASVYPIKGKEFQFQANPSTIPLETLDIDEKVGNGPSFNNSVVVGQFQSLPSNILALVYKGVTYDE